MKKSESDNLDASMREYSREQCLELKMLSRIRSLSPQFTPKYSSAKLLHSKQIQALWDHIMDCIINNKAFDCSLLAKFYKDYDWSTLFKSPLKLLPNVRTFKIVGLSNYDKTFAKHGIQKREFDPQIETTPFKNKKINAFLLHQEKRLIGSLKAGDFRKFWRISSWLLFRSTAFALYCFPRVNEG